jgi:hypothetical protein
MAKTFQMTLVRRLANPVVTALLRAGIKIGPTVLLSVRGRKSGKLYTTPVTPVEQDEQC